MTSPELSLIIPSKDRASILAVTLAKVYQAIQNVNAEVLIINDSKTEEVIVPVEYQDKVRAINNPSSGVASARNLGARHAAAPLLVFMDDDMWVSADNIKATLALHQQYKKEAWCFNLNWVYPPDLQAYVQSTQFGRYLHHYGFDSLEGWCRGLPWDNHKLFATPGITSQYLAIRKVDFEQSGGYNEKFPHAGFEDHEFSQRLAAHSIQPYILPTSVMYHNEADRMNLHAWLARKRRGGETRRVAVELGHKELVYNYGALKGGIYRVVGAVQPLVLGVLSLIPNTKALDKLYFSIMNLLLGTALYTGYQTLPQRK
ncbi:glycosyltransferase [Hymenobacter sediminis]|uniref:glycosyltransferase family 2 protein n=1 Tax=Hymenobacter sediminis TaxID=2218621 RepID=UPI000DA68E9F|nr:glycosyltransferase family 2 protein [Hymenobacter sediminis]RPD46901.1 glycosyltransferase [Hymenobacter sediminis]